MKVGETVTATFTPTEYGVAWHVNAPDGATCEGGPRTVSGEEAEHVPLAAVEGETSCSWKAGATGGGWQQVSASVSGPCGDPDRVARGVAEKAVCLQATATDYYAAGDTWAISGLVTTPNGLGAAGVVQPGGPLSCASSTVGLPPDQVGPRTIGGTVGLYGEQVLPRIINVACGMKANRPLRERVCAGLHGRVLELGFGSGHNVPFYPDAVDSVAGVEPADLGWKLAAERLAASEVTVERAGLDGQSLPLPDDSCDTAVSTWTMCTIPDIAAALAEVRRVLKPGGTLHFVEHGLAPDEKVQRWQHRLEPVQKRAFGGCHLTRRIPDLLTDAGFTLRELDVFYEDGAPKFLAADSLGVAVSA